jgi:hypothetical protein
MNTIFKSGLLLLVLSMPLHGQDRDIAEIRKIYTRVGAQIAAGELLHHRIELESSAPATGDKHTEVRFYYSLVQDDPEGNTRPVLAKITLQYSLAASSSHYSEFLFDDAGEPIFYYARADGYACREARFYLKHGGPVKIKVNPLDGDCVEDRADKSPDYERTTDFDDGDRANAGRVVAKAVQYKTLFAHLVRADGSPEPKLSMPAPQAGPASIFASAYTDFLGPGCRDVEGLSEDGDTPQICEGIGGYQLYVYYNYYGHELLRLQAVDGEFEVPLGAETCDDTQLYSAEVEWRTAAGRPFAVVAQTTCHYLVLAEEDGLEYEAFEAGDSYILVKGLAGFEHIDHEIELKDDTTVDRARKLADTGYASPR